MATGNVAARDAPDTPNSVTKGFLIDEEGNEFAPAASGGLSLDSNSDGEFAGAEDPGAGAYHEDELPVTRARSAFPRRSSNPLLRRTFLAAGLAASACSAAGALYVFRAGYSAPREEAPGAFWNDIVAVRPTELWAIRSSHERHRKAVLTECVLDSGLGTGYLARMGIEINEAVMVCPEAKKLERESIEKYVSAAHFAHRIVMGSRSREEIQSDSKSMLARANDTLAQLPAWQKQLESLRKEHLAKQGLHAVEVAAAIGTAEDVEVQAEAVENDALNSSNASGEGSDGEEPLDAENEVDSEEHPASGQGSGGSDAEEARENVNEFTEALTEAKNLRGEARESKKLCAAAAAGTFASFSYAISYGAAVVTECPGRHRRWEYCVADATRMLGSMSELAAGAAAISAQCTSDWKYITNPGEIDDRRRLTAGDEDTGGTSLFNTLMEQKSHWADRHQQKAETMEMQAECGIDVTQAAMFIARSGAEINAIVEHCAVNHQDAFCGATISGLLAAFASASMMLSDVAVECPQRLTFGAICSAAVSQLIASLSELSAGSWALAETCVYTDFESDSETEDGLNDEGPEFGGPESPEQVDQLGGP